MAEFAKGTYYAMQNDPTPANIVDPGLLGGKLRVFQDTFSVGAAANLNSTNYFSVGGKLPAGSQVVKIILGAPGTTALGTQNSLIVGDQGDDNRYMTTVEVSAASVQVGPNVSTGMGYTVTGTTDNYIRVGGANAGTRISTNTFKISVFYVVE